MFEEDGTLKESLKERNRSITVIAGINLMIHGSLCECPSETSCE